MPASEASCNNSELSRRRRALHCGCSSVLMQRTHALCSTGCTSLLPPPVHVPAGIVRACRSMKSGAATDGCAVKRLKIIMIVIVIDAVIVIVIVIEIEIVMMILMMLTKTTMTKMMVVAAMVVVGLGGGGCKKEESARGEKQTRRRDMHLERPCSQCPVQVNVRVGVWVQASCTCDIAFGLGQPIKKEFDKAPAPQGAKNVCARHEHTPSHQRTNTQPPNLQTHTTTCGTCA
jgi:hypothetical protein